MIIGLNKRSEGEEKEWIKRSKLVYIFLLAQFFDQNTAGMKAKNFISLSLVTFPATFGAKTCSLILFCQKDRNPISILELYQIMVPIWKNQKRKKYEVMKLFFAGLVGSCNRENGCRCWCTIFQMLQMKL